MQIACIPQDKNLVWTEDDKLVEQTKISSEEFFNEDARWHARRPGRNHVRRSMASNSEVTLLWHETYKVIIPAWNGIVPLVSTSFQSQGHYAYSIFSITWRKIDALTFTFIMQARSSQWFDEFDVAGDCTLPQTHSISGVSLIMSTECQDSSKRATTKLLT